MFEVSCVSAEYDSGKGDPHAAQLQRIDLYSIRRVFRQIYEVLNLILIVLIITHSE